MEWLHRSDQHRVQVSIVFLILTLYDVIYFFQTSADLYFLFFLSPFSINWIYNTTTTFKILTESETFDLAGQNVTTIITNTIQSAFRDPLPTTEMVRITFVTGAGKLGRQKYDDGAAKAVTLTLRELGFVFRSNLRLKLCIHLYLSSFNKS